MFEDAIGWWESDMRGWTHWRSKDLIHWYDLHSQFEGSFATTNKENTTYCSGAHLVTKPMLIEHD